MEPGSGARRARGFQEAVEWLKTMAPVTEHAQVACMSAARVQESVENIHVTENTPFKGSYNKYFVPSEWLAKRGILPATLEMLLRSNGAAPSSMPAGSPPWLWWARRARRALSTAIVGISRAPEQRERSSKWEA